MIRAYLESTSSLQKKMVLVAASSMALLYINMQCSSYDIIAIYT